MPHEYDSTVPREAGYYWTVQDDYVGRPTLSYWSQQNLTEAKKIDLILLFAGPVRMDDDQIPADCQGMPPCPCGKPYHATISYEANGKKWFTSMCRDSGCGWGSQGQTRMQAIEAWKRRAPKAEVAPPDWRHRTQRPDGDRPITVITTDGATVYLSKIDQYSIWGMHKDFASATCNGYEILKWSYGFHPGSEEAANVQ